MPLNNWSEPCRLFVTKIKDVYTLPSVVFTCNLLVNDPHSTAQMVSDALSTDVVMAAKILRLVNSAYYGFSKQVSSLKTAIVILGFRELQKLVMGLGAVKALSRFSNGFSYPAFWRHSIAVAVFAEKMLQKKTFRQHDNGFVAGLLHDIGKLLLAQEADRGQMNEFKRLIAEGRHETEAEQELFGFDHAELGALLGAQWHFPDALVSAIRYHHTLPQEGNDPLCAAIHLSDICVRSCLINAPGSGRLPVFQEPAWQMLELDEADLPELFSTLNEGMAMINDFVSDIETTGGHAVTCR